MGDLDVRSDGEFAQGADLGLGVDEPNQQEDGKSGLSETIPRLWVARIETEEQNAIPWAVWGEVLDLQVLEGLLHHLVVRIRGQGIGPGPHVGMRSRSGDQQFVTPFDDLHGQVAAVVLQIDLAICGVDFNGKALDARGVGLHEKGEGDRGAPALEVDFLAPGAPLFPLK